jgi:hypothetical protein
LIEGADKQDRKRQRVLHLEGLGEPAAIMPAGLRGKQLGQPHQPGEVLLVLELQQPYPALVGQALPAGIHVTPQPLQPLQLLGLHPDPVAGDADQEQREVVDLARLALPAALQEEQQDRLRRVDADEIREAADVVRRAATVGEGGGHLAQLGPAELERHRAGRMGRRVRQEVMASEVIEVGVHLGPGRVGKGRPVQRVVGAVVGHRELLLRPARHARDAVVPGPAGLTVHLLGTAHQAALEESLPEPRDDLVIDRRRAKAAPEQ